MPRRIITEEELREAAREVLEYELAIFDSYNEYPDHIFHGKFRLNMAALLHEVKRGAIEAAKYSMGFTFYAKQCIAAVLLIFTLSCIAMPETVLAGYHKLIEVIETVCEEYTEYRYRVNDDGGIEETFKPLKLGYLPEGMEEAERRTTAKSVHLVYADLSEKYFIINQKEIWNNNKVLYAVDNLDAKEYTILLGDKLLSIIKTNSETQFIYEYNNYRIIGKSNLPEEEIINILSTMNF